MFYLSYFLRLCVVSSTFTLSRFNCHRCLKLCLNGLSCCVMVSGAERSRSALVCSVSQVISARFHAYYMLDKKTTFKQSCLVWLCLHDWPPSKAVREGGRLNNTHISSFSALRDIVVVNVQLFMAKQEASSFAPSFPCCADSSVKLLPNTGLNWNHICADVPLLAQDELMFLPS